MSTNDDDTNTNEIVGTANNNKQHRLYRELCDLYTPEGASHIAAANLRRNGKPASPEIIQAWDQVCQWNHEGAMDLEQEAVIAAAAVNAVTGAAMRRGQDAPAPAPQPEPTEDAFVDDEGGDDDEDETDEEEGVGVEAWGYDDPEDNAEHAYDDFLKNSGM